MDLYRDDENTQRASLTTTKFNRVEPAYKPGLDFLEKDEVKTKRPSMWNIVFYNDDYTPMDFINIYPDKAIS